MNAEARRLLAILGLLAASPSVGTRLAMGGPPFVTDDPEPVEHRHWEFYVASQYAETTDDRSGTAPHFEVNCGAIPDVQLHLIAPMAYDAPGPGSPHYGYGDTEFGAKYRFIRESASFPQVGIFPLLEIPSGNADRNLGSGHVQAFLPVWIQRSWGAENRQWTAYGGGGYDINPGAGNLDWGLLGMVLQRQVRKDLLLGGELYHQSVTIAGGHVDTEFNLGTVVDFGDRHHLLFCAGRSIDGPTRAHVYLAYQLTTGPGQ